MLQWLPDRTDSRGKRWLRVIAILVISVIAAVDTELDICQLGETFLDMA
jgi:hypothetical protein